MKQKWSKEDKRRFSDRDILRATTIRGKTKPPPEVDEWTHNEDARILERER